MSSKKNTTQIALFLLLLSALLHGLHFMLFRDMHHLSIFLLSDLAFVPLEVLFVSLVIKSVIEGREKANLNEKLNMLIGLFFQELGLKLLRKCTMADPHIDDFSQRYHITPDWTDKEYNTLVKFMNKQELVIDYNKVDFDKVYCAIDQKKELLMSLIANPAILEHDTFSDLLMSVTHMHEELALRVKLNDEDPTRHDQDHLRSDLERVYFYLIHEWIHYMKHLKVRYPFLFTTALINNPFEKHKRTEIEKEVRSQVYD